MKDIKTGDRVRFKAANLTMTVERVVKSYCVCSWVDGPHQRTFIFPHHVLSKVIEAAKEKAGV